MNLADMLCFADIHELSRIAKAYDCNCSSNSKNELIQSILSTVGRREIFDGLVSGLETEDIRFLNSLLFDRRDSFSLEDLLARANQTKEGRKEHEAVWNPRDMIARFKERGWLFNGYSQQTKYLYRIPEDLKRRFSDTLTSHFSRNIVKLPQPPVVYRDEQDLLAEDILTVLRTIREKELPLNAEGYIYKKQLHQMLDHLSVKEEPVGKTAWRFGYGRKFREYPTRFSYIYDYCYYHGLLEEQGHFLRLTPAGEEKAAAGKREDPLQIYIFWLRLYRVPIPNVSSLVYWINRLSKEWVSVSSLGEVIRKLIKPFYYDEPASIYENRLLPMLVHLGVIRFGADGEYGSAVQSTRLGGMLVGGTYVSEEETIVLKD